MERPFFSSRGRGEPRRGVCAILSGCGCGVRSSRRPRAGGSLASPEAGDIPAMTMTMIRGGRIADGTGDELFEADLLIEDDRVGGLLLPGEEAPAVDREIDATGCIVAPGFIDMHSHADWVLALADHGDLAKPYLEQGITRWLRLARRVPGEDVARPAARLRLAVDGRVSRAGGEAGRGAQPGGAGGTREPAPGRVRDPARRHVPRRARALPRRAAAVVRRGCRGAQLRPRLRPGDVLAPRGAGGLVPRSRRGGQARDGASQGAELDLAHLPDDVSQAPQPARPARDARHRAAHGDPPAALALHLRGSEELVHGGPGTRDGRGGTAPGCRRHDRRLSLHLRQHHRERADSLLVSRHGAARISLGLGSRPAASRARARLPPGGLRVPGLPGDGCRDRGRRGDRRPHATCSSISARGVAARR